MDIKQAVRLTRLLRLLAGCSASILICGCTVPEGAYRNVYGPGSRDWDPGRSYPDRPLLDQGIAVPESGESAQGKRRTHVPIENAGRPEPPRSRIPGISELPEIPDEPTVLPE